MWKRQFSWTRNGMGVSKFKSSSHCKCFMFLFLSSGMITELHTCDFSWDESLFPEIPMKAVFKRLSMVTLKVSEVFFEVKVRLLLNSHSSVDSRRKSSSLPLPSELSISLNILLRTISFDVYQSCSQIVMRCMFLDMHSFHLFWCLRVFVTLSVECQNVPLYSIPICTSSMSMSISRGLIMFVSQSLIEKSGYLEEMIL